MFVDFGILARQERIPRRLSRQQSQQSVGQRLDFSRLLTLRFGRFKPVGVARSHDRIWRVAAVQVSLVVIQGKPEGMAIPLRAARLFIGRDSQCHVRPRNELVSKMHCEISQREQAVFVRDLQSLNGTFLKRAADPNEQQISGEVEVHNGDLLRVATLVFEFKILSEEPTAPLLPLDLSDGEIEGLLNRPQVSDTSLLGPAARTVRMKAVDLESVQPADVEDSD